MTYINEIKNREKHKGSDVFVEAFARGLSVIRAFDSEQQGLTLSDIAARTELTAAGARRLLHTLVTLGYARYENRRFYLTPTILKLGYSYLSSLSIREIAQPLVEGFAKSIGEVCTLAVLDHADVVYIVRAELRSPLSRGLNIGDRLPAHATSTGHVLLAGLQDDEMNEILRLAPLKRFTPYTPCTKKEIKKVVQQARENGWSIANQHLELGVCGLAVPVVDKSGRAVAALTVSVNLARHSETEIIDRFLEPLQAIAKQLHLT